MPKILQINSCLDKSTGRIAQQIGEKAIEAGYESYIAYPRRAGKCQSLSHTIEIGSNLDSVCHAVMTRIFDRHGLESRFATKKLIRQIELLRPDVIHLHNIHGYYINYRLLFKYLSKSGVPVVWTFHDCWPVTGHCVHFTDVNCYKWENGICENCPKKGSYPAAILLDRSSNNYINKKDSFTLLNNLIIVPVSYWLDSIVKRSFLRDYQTVVIQNGIDLKIFHARREKSKIIRERYGWIDKYVILGVAIGWSEDVGLSTFYKLRQSLTDDFAIALVGVTEKQLKNLPAGITGILRTSNQDELAEIYTAADVLFNGSYQETFGLVTAESMACGTPVIVYDSTACPEIVDHDRGRVIPVGDLNSLLEAIYSLRNLTPLEKEMMSEACVNYVLTHIEKHNKFQEYIQLYNNLL